MHAVALLEKQKECVSRRFLPLLNQISQQKVQFPAASGCCTMHMQHSTARPPLISVELGISCMRAIYFLRKRKDEETLSVRKDYDVAARRAEPTGVFDSTHTASSLNGERGPGKRLLKGSQRSARSDLRALGDKNDVLMGVRSASAQRQNSALRCAEYLWRADQVVTA